MIGSISHLYSQFITIRALATDGPNCLNALAQQDAKSTVVAKALETIAGNLSILITKFFSYIQF